MTSLRMRLTIAAAVLFAAGAASAQTMKADIPFAFQAGGKVMEAGTYLVDLHGPGTTVVIRHASGGTALMAMYITQIEGTRGTARLVFQCSRGNCSLEQAWSRYTGVGLLFMTPKLDRNEEASLAVIRLRPDAAD
jgi:hypothetical protein